MKVKLNGLFLIIVFEVIQSFFTENFNFMLIGAITALFGYLMLCKNSISGFNKARNIIIGYSIILSLVFLLENILKLNLLQNNLLIIFVIFLGAILDLISFGYLVKSISFVAFISKNTYYESKIQSNFAIYMPLRIFSIILQTLVIFLNSESSITYILAVVMIVVFAFSIFSKIIIYYNIFKLYKEVNGKEFTLENIQKIDKEDDYSSYSTREEIYKTKYDGKIFDYLRDTLRWK